MYGIISATPNQNVANKNRKTKFDEIVEEINKLQEFHKKLVNLLTNYCNDTAIELPPINSIIDNEIISDNKLKIKILDNCNYEDAYFIPKDWINDREKYLDDYKKCRLDEQIEVLSNQIHRYHQDIENYQKYANDCKIKINELHELKNNLLNEKRNREKIFSKE